MTAYVPVEVKEPHKGLKITGGIISLGTGAAIIGVYIFYFIFSIFFGYIAIIFGEPRYWFLLILYPIILAGGALLITGGIMGFTGLSKTGVILSFLGSGLSIGYNVYLWNVAHKVEDLAALMRYPMIGLPIALISLIGGVLLAVALRNGA